MSGARSRNKGANGEREVANILKAAGYPAVRTPLSGGMQWKGDVQGVPNLHLEVKRAERLNVPSWIRQAEADCPKGSVPVVVFRQNQGAWYAVIRFDHFIPTIPLLGEAA